MGDANKEARGKAVMMGPRAMKDMKERSLKNMGKGAEISNHFREGNDSTYFLSFYIHILLVLISGSNS